MAALCGTGTRELGLVKDLLDSTDCHVRALTEIAYGALSGPDSEFPLILTVLMTIAVALFGLRLLLGFSPLKVGDLTLTGCVESPASTIPEIIDEIAIARVTERGATRGDDRFSEAAMEDRKKEGYF